MNPFNPEEQARDRATKALDGIPLPPGAERILPACAPPAGAAFPALEDAPAPAAGAADEWDMPQPLPDALPPVAPFAPELLPEELRDWVTDIAERMQCPPDFIAVGAIAALSSLVGARAVVAPKQHDDWRVVPNLWGLIVGRPGVMKSPALSEALKPLNGFEREERKSWEKEHQNWKLDCKVAGMADKAKEKEANAIADKDPAKARSLLTPSECPAEPTKRRYILNDTTAEALLDTLAKSPKSEWGVLVYRDELHGLLKDLEKQGQEGARSFFLTGYDGNQPYQSDRVGRGHSHVNRLCLAMLGGIQPGILHSYVREAVTSGSGDDGLLQRFGLVVWPDIQQEFTIVDRWPNTSAKQAAQGVFERLSQLQPASEHQPQEWRFSPEAQTLFYEWWQPFETSIRSGDMHPAIASHFAKYRKLVPALALLFALIDTPESEGVIHAAELLRALAWSDYLGTHAVRIYSAATVPETATALALLKKISDGKLQEPFAPWQVAVKHWTGLGTPDAVRKAANLLADYGWLRQAAPTIGASGGRPSERYLIHPMLLQQGEK